MYTCLMYVLLFIIFALIAGLAIVLVQQRRRDQQRRARDTELDAWLADYSPSAFSPTDSSQYDL